MTFKIKLVDPAPPISIAEWKRRARRKLPDIAWAYIESGADDLVTLRENVSGFENWRLRQRCLRGIKRADLSATMCGERVALPLALAPTGMTGLSNWRGDIAATRAAERRGIRAVLSTASSYSLEEVADATDANHWFQLYPFANREKVGSLIDRARAAGYSALFVTVDVPVRGNREGELRAGMSTPWTLTPARLLNIMTRPKWVYDVVRHQRLKAVHYFESGSGRGGSSVANSMRRVLQGAADDAAASAEAQARYMQADLDWQDLAWMRDRWKGPLYVKGILDPDDAARAVDEFGADGVVVSNHGGRQLDRTRATIDALPDIANRIGDRADVYLDGGIRRGTDVITALALGAKGVFIGRPYLYGLAAGGESGVGSVLDIFRSEIERALVLMGCNAVEALDRSWLVPASRHDLTRSYREPGSIDGVTPIA